MKYPTISPEIIYSLLLLALFYMTPTYLKQMSNSFFGKLILLAFIIFSGHLYGRNVAIISAFISILLLQSNYEGLEDMNGNGDSEESGEEDTGMDLNGEDSEESGNMDINDDIDMNINEEDENGGMDLNGKDSEQQNNNLSMSQVDLDSIMRTGGVDSKETEVTDEMKNENSQEEPEAMPTNSTEGFATLY